MDPVARIAEDEFDYFREILQDDELARQIAKADNRTAAALLIRSGLLIIDIVLWRQRTGDSLRNAMDVIDAIKRGEEIAPD